MGFYNAIYTDRFGSQYTFLYNPDILIKMNFCYASWEKGNWMCLLIIKTWRIIVTGLTGN